MATALSTNPNDGTLNLLITKSNNKDPKSMFSLGLKFALGTGGVQYNKDKAVHLITSAAKLGYLPAKQWIRNNSIAQVHIALLCEKKIKDEESKPDSINPGHQSNNKSKQTKNAVAKSDSHYSKQTSKKLSKQNKKAVQHPRHDLTPKPLSTYEEAIRLLSDHSSESSHGKVMSLMGSAAFSGDSNALRWLNNKAEKRDNDALLILGKAYTLGFGVTASMEKARTLLESIDPPTPEADYYLGLASLPDDLPNAVQHICNAAGEGYKDAIRWVRKNLDDSDTFSQLTSCYMNGFHDPILEMKISESALEGNLKSVKAITKDALNGSKDALCTAGKLYEFGIGVEKSIDRAYELYSRSNTPESYYRAAEILMFKGNTPNSRIVNMYYLAAVRGYRDARARLLHFSEEGDPAAMYFMGILYDKDRDFTNALRTMKKAASSGSESAKQWLEEQKESIQSDSENSIGPYGDVSW